MLLAFAPWPAGGDSTEDGRSKKKERTWVLDDVTELLGPPAWSPLPLVFLMGRRRSHC